MSYAAMIRNDDGLRFVLNVKSHVKIGDTIGSARVQCLFETASDAVEYHQECMETPDSKCGSARDREETFDCRR